MADTITVGSHVRIRCRYLISYHSDRYKTNGRTGVVEQIEPVFGHSYCVRFDEPMKGEYATLYDSWYSLEHLRLEPTHAEPNS